jgi:tetratricopeptide (TPR) repeat protein
MLGVACLAFAPSVAFGGWVGDTMCACPGRHKPLGNNANCEDACYGTRSAPSGGNSSPSYDNGAARRAQEAAEANAAAERRDVALSQNNKGIEAFNKGDWATAIPYFQQALQNSPDDPVIRKNLANAQANMAQQQEREREAAERQRRDKTAADNMQRSIQSFAQTLNATQVSGGLDFDGRTSGNAPGGGNSGGLDFTATVAPPSKPLPSGDPMVVDARNVPSGLPKGLDNAIAGAYSSAPPEVSDRVRKGFQAVMGRDWKAAKAWFQDALNRDPNNPGLKRLVALADSPQQPDMQPATVDARNELAGLGGKSNSKITPPPNKAKPPVFSPGTQIQLPDPDDLLFLFPGLQAMKDREAPVYKTLPDGRRVQLPQDSDMDYLFGPGTQSPVSKKKSAKTKSSP